MDNHAIPQGTAQQRSPKRKKPVDDVYHVLKRIHTQHLTEYFFEMLAEAVDRDLTQESIRQRLEEATQTLKRAQKELNEVTCVQVFVSARVSVIPELDKDLEARNQFIHEHGRQMAETIEEQELLQRLADSREELRRLFHWIYDCFNALIDSGELLRGMEGYSLVTPRDNIVVPDQFISCLRLNTDCSRQILKQSLHRLRQTRQEFLRVSKSIQTISSARELDKARLGKAQSLLDLRRRKDIIQIQRPQQDERDTRFLRDHAQPFLTSIGRFHSNRSLSAASSRSDVTLIKTRPRDGPGPIASTTRPPKRTTGLPGSTSIC